MLTSNRTLQKISSTLDEKTFFDINLRAPWWTKKLLQPLLKHTHWLKLNEDEILTLAHLFFDTKSTKVTAAAKRLKKHFDLDSIIVTKGAEGALVSSSGKKILQESAPRQINIKDTVGAGDAFSAVCIFGLFQRWSWQKILNRAVGFAGKICTIQGATTNDKSLYIKTLDQWSHDD